MAEDKDKNSELEGLKKDLADVVKTMGTMGETLKGLSGLGETLKGLKTDIEGLKTKEPPKKKPKESPNLELMSRAELRDYLLGEFKSILQDELKPLSENVSKVDQTARTDRTTRQLRAAEKKYPDFWEWKEEMIELGKRVNGLTVEQAYKLAKEENPDKAKDLKEKYKSEEEKKAEEKAQKAKEKKANPFGGLTPTSGKTSEDGKNLGKEDAAELAWQKVFGGQADEETV